VERKRDRAFVVCVAANVWSCGSSQEARTHAATRTTTHPRTAHAFLRTHTPPRPPHPFPRHRHIHLTMIVYKDVISGDEVVSASLPPSLPPSLRTTTCLSCLSICVSVLHSFAVLVVWRECVGLMCAWWLGQRREEGRKRTRGPCDDGSG